MRAILEVRKEQGRFEVRNQGVVLIFMAHQKDVARLAWLKRDDGYVWAHIRVDDELVHDRLAK